MQNPQISRISIRPEMYHYDNQTGWLDRYGEAPHEPFRAEVVGSRILEYASEVQSGKYLHDPRVPEPSDIFERERLLDFMNNCSETYLTRSNPRRFLLQRNLFEEVSGTQGTAVMVEVSLKSFPFLFEKCGSSRRLRTTLHRSINECALIYPYYSLPPPSLTLE